MGKFNRNFPFFYLFCLMSKFNIRIQSLDQLPGLAEQLILSLKDHKLLAFTGKMGVGKTTFIKTLCKTLGVTEIVTSPTFAIINQYESGHGDPIFHFDFYRLESHQEALNIGVFDYWDSGHFCFMEWPEKVEKLLPEECVYIEIEEDELSGDRIFHWKID